MLVLYPRYLTLSIYILEEIEYVRCPDYALVFYSFGIIYVHVKFNVGLKKGQDEVNLACATSSNDGQD